MNAPPSIISKAVSARKHILEAKRFITQLENWLQLNGYDVEQMRHDNCFLRFIESGEYNTNADMLEAIKHDLDIYKPKPEIEPDVDDMKGELRNLRIKYNVTLQELSDYIGVTKQAINVWEIDPNRKIARKYNILIKEFFEQKEKQQKIRHVTKRRKRTGWKYE